MNRNIRLFLEDLYFPLIKYKERRVNFKIKQQQDNKKEVLALYRMMLKTLPKMEETYLEERNTYEKIKFNFREGSRETDLNIVNNLKNICYVIVEKTNKGVYPPFPKFKA